METDKEVLNKIVSERADKIHSEVMEQIKHIQERYEEELSRIVPELMNQIENFSTFKLLDVLDILRDGGTVKTCEYESSWDNNRWQLTVGSDDVFYKEQPYKKVGKGRYKITLIMEKLAEETED